VNEGEIVPVEASPIVKPATTPEAMVQQMELFERLKAQLLDPNTDICDIKGKPYVKRSGWRKLALAFNISDEIISSEKEEGEDGSVTWRTQVKAIAPNGRTSIGVGACSSRERSFAHPEHDIYAIAHTRAKNRAISDLIGPGEVSAEEMQENPRVVSNVANNSKTGPTEDHVFAALAKAGIMNSDKFSVYRYGKAVRVEPQEELADMWPRYDAALKDLGAVWVDDPGRWEIAL